MTTQEPDGEGTPEKRGGTPSTSEEVWLKFLTDSEGAIRRSAPKEPSARERAPGPHPRTAGADRAGPRTRYPHDESASSGMDAVGDLWQPDDAWPGPPWRNLDRRARLRRVGHVIATAAAVALALGAWSWFSTSAGTPDDATDDIIVQQLEDLPHELPTATHAPPGSAVTQPSWSTVTAG
ncbi:hypothetical protein OG800_01825 [Streptomyces sp. NBC_00445]|uniref:hypothetical protein n=1 Tax=unclassified Streptomyces TaxID=2593676 RepID=UPI002E1EF6C8|nr:MULTISPECIES: hypothetical protein [unclassified Streptomyces]